MNMNFIRGILYEMKKDYGVDLRYITLVHSEMQVDTGKRAFIKNAYNIRAIALPRRGTRKFIQDIGYLAANKNFTYGALNDYNDVKFIIDCDDLPRGLDINLDGYLVYNHKRYEKVDFEMIEHQLAFMLTAKGMEGGKPYDIVAIPAKDGLQLQQRVSYELN